MAKRKSNPLTVIKRHLKQVKMTAEGHQKKKAMLEDAQAQLNSINAELPTLITEVETLTEYAMYLSKIDLGIEDSNEVTDAAVEKAVATIISAEEEAKAQAEAEKLAQAV